MTSESSSDKAAPNRGMGQSFGLIGMAFLAGMLAQHVLAGRLSPRDTQIASVIVGLVAFISVLAAGWHIRFNRVLASNRLAVPALMVLTFLSILGTLILQNEPERSMLNAYGPSTLSLIRGLFLDDLFHSFGFSAVLGLTAGGLGLTLARKRRWSLRTTGAMAAHLGLLVMLAGVVLGNVWGTKGRLDMHKGDSADRFHVQTASGQVAEVPLGFTVCLDDFQLERYEPEFRLMLFDTSGKQRRLESLDPGSEKVVALRPYGVQSVQYWPDHESRVSVEPRDLNHPASGDGLPALGIQHPGKKLPEWAFDEGQPEGGELVLGGVRLAFFWDEKRAAAFLESQAAVASGSPHMLLATGQEIPVEVGKAYPLPGSDHRVEIRRALVDFIMDANRGEPKNRSRLPNNPALQVAILDVQGKVLATRWLFAKFPSFHGKDQAAPGSGLGYRYTEPTRSASAIAVGATAELWQIAEGKIQARVALEKDKPFKFGDSQMTLVAVYGSAIRKVEDITRSDRALNPLVRIHLSDESGSVTLGPKQPLKLADDKVLVLASKEGETVRDYLSTLSVIDNGAKVLTRVVEVNYPLVYRGYAFFQTNYKEDDPTYSGFQVVRDPGIWIVYLGFVLNTVGIFCALFLPPVLKRRRARLAASGGTS